MVGAENGSAAIEVLGGGGPERYDRRVPWVTAGVVVAVAVGILVGGLAVHAWDEARVDVGPPGRSAESLRFSLGAQTGALAGTERGKAVVALTVVVSNDGTAPVTLQAIQVQGPGAGFVASPAGGPSTELPQTTAAGQSSEVRFGLSSDCSVPVRPLPTVRFIVRDVHGNTQSVAAQIPDLDVVWGQSLSPPACQPD